MHVNWTGHNLQYYNVHAANKDSGQSESKLVAQDVLLHPVIIGGTYD